MNSRTWREYSWDGVSGTDPNEEEVSDTILLLIFTSNVILKLDEFRSPSFHLIISKETFSFLGCLKTEQDLWDSIEQRTNKHVYDKYLIWILWILLKDIKNWDEIHQIITSLYAFMSLTYVILSKIPNISVATIYMGPESQIVPETTGIWHSRSDYAQKLPLAHELV